MCPVISILFKSIPVKWWKKKKISSKLKSYTDMLKFRLLNYAHKKDFPHKYAYNVNKVLRFRQIFKLETWKKLDKNLSYLNKIRCFIIKKLRKSWRLQRSCENNNCFNGHIIDSLIVNHGSFFCEKYPEPL